MMLAWACALLAAGGLFMVCANLGVFPALAPARYSGIDVVACVAMRNEEQRASRCIASLLAQPGISGVIVADDDSSDGTAAIAEQFARIDPRVRVVRANGSKRAALAAAAQAAQHFAHRYLFFTDADVELDPGALGALVRYAQRTGAGAVTAWPRTANGSWADRLLIPAITLLLLHALPMRASRAGNAKIAAGNGQIFLIEWDAYSACGGHAAIGSPVEDVALAQNLARAGYPAVFASASRFASADGYGSMQNAVQGLGRSLYCSGGVPACLGFALWQIAAFVLPFALLPFAIVPASVAVAAGVSSRWIVAARMREPLLPALFVPLSGIVCAAAACAAAVLGLRGSLTWRGRQPDA